jgi:hypothetical protein
MAYTTIDDPSAHFQAFTYTGNGSNRTITLPGNSDLKFDLYWYKQRSQAGHHRMFDTSRGLSLELYPDLNAADSAATYFNNQQANSFDIIANDSATNTGDVTFANWQWKANGGTTTSVSESQYNAGGTYQKNETAGFSIVSYTGIDTVGEVTHGLTTQPQVVIVKRRNSTGNWATYHESAGITGTLFLDTTAAKGNTTAYFHTGWGSATKFPIGSDADTNADGATYVAYVFSERQGYSKFGSYVGNGNANGTFVYTGFKPAFIMVKTTAVSDEWNIYDTKRSGSNPNNDALYASSNVVEDAGSTYAFMDMVSNGFKLRRATHSPNKASTYIYMAFAEQPFVTSTGTPATAR